MATFKKQISCHFSLRDNKIEDLTSTEVSMKFKILIYIQLNPILILFAI
jgi:hypothetical protein